MLYIITYFGIGIVFVAIMGKNDKICVKDIPFYLFGIVIWPIILLFLTIAYIGEKIEGKWGHLKNKVLYDPNEEVDENY